MLRRFSVDVELLSKKGGGRRYTYRYNLHYSPPEPGEIVVVPFSNWLLSAVVLASSSAENASISSSDNQYSESDSQLLTGKTSEYIKKYRPILGVERKSQFVTDIAKAGFKIMNQNLKSAYQAFSLFMPASFENECNVCYEVSNEAGLSEYFDSLLHANRLTPDLSASLQKALLQATDRPKRIGIRESNLLLGERTDKTSLINRNSLLQALVNMGFVRFGVIPKNNEYDQWSKADYDQPDISPNLFTESRLIPVTKRQGVIRHFSDSIPVFVTWSTLAEMLNVIVKNHEDSLLYCKDNRLKLIITPSKSLSGAVIDLLSTEGIKTSDYCDYTTPARLRKLIKAQHKKNSTEVIIGTTGITNILSLLDPADVFVIDADSHRYESEPSRPSIIEQIAAIIKNGSSVTFHHFPGAGAKEAAVKPTKPLSPYGIDWDVKNPDNWKTSEDDDYPEISIITESLRFGEPLLVVHNRLGQGSGFCCADCFSFIGCPECDSALHSSEGMYICKICGATFLSCICKICGSSNIAKVAEGAHGIARRLESIIGKDEVKYVAADKIEDADNLSLQESEFASASVIVSTDVCLYKTLPITPRTIIVFEIADKFQRYSFAGAESVVSYLAEVAGYYASPSTKLLLLNNRFKNPVIGWLKNDDISYFDRRYKLAQKLALPPFAARYILRIRLNNDKHLHTFFEILKETLGSDNVSKPRYIRGGSAIKKVIEYDLAVQMTVCLRHKLLDAGRKLGIEIILYSTYA